MTDKKEYDKKTRKPRLFPSAADDAVFATSVPEEHQAGKSSAFLLAYDDKDFLQRDEMRAVRIMLELSKPELTLNEYDIEHTVVIFGSARISDPDSAETVLDAARQSLEKDPDNKRLQKQLRISEKQMDYVHYYQEARELAKIITQESRKLPMPSLHIITGGGPGIMEAANRGAIDVGGQSIGLNIVLPHEQYPNSYITPELCFRFHYFAMRKMHFLMRAQALVVFPGGFGTLDELFETLTLVQTGKVKNLPILLFGKAYWNKIINFEAMVEEGMIDAENLDLFVIVESAQEAWQHIKDSLAEIDEHKWGEASEGDGDNQINA